MIRLLPEQSRSTLFVVQSATFDGTSIMYISPFCSSFRHYSKLKYMYVNKIFRKMMVPFSCLFLSDLYPSSYQVAATCYTTTESVLYHPFPISAWKNID